MANHETSIVDSDEWYTPEWVLAALGVRFDLDPCCGSGSPAERWCANRLYAFGLECKWDGNVWLNPPFGKRNDVRHWLGKLATHGHGIALVQNRTGTDWWQDYAQIADCLLFVRGKIKFERPDGSIGDSPGYGNVLMAYGETMANALRSSSISGLRSWNA